MENALSKDIKYFKGVGEKRAILFNKMGIYSAEDLIAHYPRRYEDWSDIKKLSQTEPDSPCCVKITVTEPMQERRLRGGRSVWNTYGTDGENHVKIVIWGNKYSASKLKSGETYLLFGKFQTDLFGYTVTSPEIKSAVDGGKIHPIYPTVSGLSVLTIEKVMAQALSETRGKIHDFIPKSILDKYNLMPFEDAVMKIHFPSNFKEAGMSRNRLAFNELMILFIMLQRMKEKSQSEKESSVIADRSDEFTKSLKFELTNAQKGAISDAAKDMQSGRQMNRLLQGDVGSGKTAVAAALIFNTAKSGRQSAFMAPTEILANQHMQTLSEFLSPFGIRTALLKGKSTAKEKREIREKLKSGEIDVLVGTHAIFQKDVEFKNLSLVITDEQHRFGVEQRAKLSAKGENPHLFVMSATPIPRTLALMIYGELDISVLDELPSGRKAIRTYAVDSGYRPRFYNYIKKHIAEGHQGYIVCPMIEENDESSFDLTAATDYFEELQNGVFAGYRLGLLHGKLKQAEKDAVMQRFADGEIDLLIATTVVEVGIDVPNATIMVIENAERFGLSQLHQLRGRIGRGQAQSDCILVSDAKGDTAVQRINVIKNSTDGFYIADEDLKLRGAGDFFGHRQSGLPNLKMADLCSESKLVYQAKDAAIDIMSNDPFLLEDQHRRLREMTDKMLADAQNNMN